jgi:hypothetical protein
MQSSTTRPPPLRRPPISDATQRRADPWRHCDPGRRGDSDGNFDRDDPPAIIPATISNPTHGASALGTEDAGKRARSVTMRSRGLRGSANTRIRNRRAEMIPQHAEERTGDLCDPFATTSCTGGR